MTLAMFESLEPYVLSDDASDTSEPLTNKRIHFTIFGIVGVVLLAYVRIEFQNDHGHSLSTIYAKSLEHIPVKCINEKTGELKSVQAHQINQNNRNSSETRILSQNPEENTLQSTFNPQNPSREKWIILGFTNMKYVEVAKVWYMQLYKLGYRNHRLGALDYTTYDYLNNITDFHGGVMYTYGARERKSVIGGKSIWQIRIDTVVEQLEAGVNIFVIDVDSIWLKYRDFSLLPTNVDIFHADGNPMPHDIASYRECYDRNE